MQLFFYLPTFNARCMRHLLYLMFRCDVDVMESLELEESFLELNTASIEQPRSRSGIEI